MGKFLRPGGKTVHNWSVVCGHARSWNRIADHRNARFFLLRVIRGFANDGDKTESLVIGVAGKCLALPTGFRPIYGFTN